MATLSKKKRFSRKKKRNISNKKKKRSQSKLKVGGTPGSLESEEYNIIDIIRDQEKIKEYLEENQVSENGLLSEEKLKQFKEGIKNKLKYEDEPKKKNTGRDGILETLLQGNNLQEIIKRVTKDLVEKKHYFRLACINPPVKFDFKKLLPTFLREEEDDKSDEISREEAERYFKETEESNKISILDYLFKKGPVTKKKLLRELFGKIIEDMFFKEKESIVEKLQYFQEKVIDRTTNFLDFDKKLFIELYNNLKNNFENDSSMTSQSCQNILNIELKKLKDPTKADPPAAVPAGPRRFDFKLLKSLGRG